MGAELVRQHATDGAQHTTIIQAMRRQRDTAAAGEPARETSGVLLGDLPSSTPAPAGPAVAAPPAAAAWPPEAPAQPGSSTYGTTMLPNGDALLFAVNAVQPGSLAGGGAADLAQNQQAAAQQAALAEFSAYVGELERNAKVTRNPKVFE